MKTPKIPTTIRPHLSPPAALRAQEAGWLSLTAQLAVTIGAGRSLAEWLIAANAASHILLDPSGSAATRH